MPPVCPLDGHRLIEQDLQAGTVGTCPRCGGEAIGRELLHRVTGHRLRPGRGAHAQSLLPCPSGHRPMRSTSIGGVPLEQCGTCRTAWFDEGERPHLAGQPAPGPWARALGALGAARAAWRSRPGPS